MSNVPYYGDFSDMEAGFVEYLIDAYSGKGGRNCNEDSIYAFAPEDGLIAIVADGLGLHGGGEVASSTAVNVMSRFMLSCPALSEETISECYNQANRAVLQNQTPTCQMKTTAVMLVCRRDTAAISHVGDSRCYHFRGGRIIYQTADHSATHLAMLRGDITPEQIRFHEDRNRLLRALGGEQTVKADITQKPVLGGDAFLLCTDGFWEYVTETEMEIELIKSGTPALWLSGLIARIGKRVSGDNDNLSAVAIFRNG